MLVIIVNILLRTLICYSQQKCIMSTHLKTTLKKSLEWETIFCKQDQRDKLNVFFNMLACVFYSESMYGFMGI